jgi:regulator of protease activity HflC (stomatin/prohibitin superfamily)
MEGNDMQSIGNLLLKPVYLVVGTISELLSNNSPDKENQRDPATHPLDIDIDGGRGRGLRWVVLGAYVSLIPLLAGLTGLVLFTIFFDGVALLGFIVGTGGGALLVASSVERLFIIRNPTTGMFVTQDNLRSLLGLGNVNVAYGPGLHIAFPWETRYSENNISLEEAPQDFEFAVQCSDGKLMVKGSFRLRPDPRFPVPFLTGVAAAAEEITGLINGKGIELLKRKKVKTALRSIGKLNEELKHEFVGKAEDTDTPTAFEKRFGIIVSDVTVEEMLPSEELQRTISALSEANAVAEGTAIMLGMTKKEAADQLKAEPAFRATYNEARDRFLSVSGNLDGMDISRTEFMLRLDGIDPKLVEAISDLAKNPNLAAAAATFANKGGGNKPNNRSRRNKKRGGGNQGDKS